MLSTDNEKAFVTIEQLIDALHSYMSSLGKGTLRENSVYVTPPPQRFKQIAEAAIEMFDTYQNAFEMGQSGRAKSLVSAADFPQIVKRLNPPNLTQQQISDVFKYITNNSISQQMNRVQFVAAFKQHFPEDKMGNRSGMDIDTKDENL